MPGYGGKYVPTAASDCKCALNLPRREADERPLFGIDANRSHVHDILHCDAGYPYPL